jgi:putative peptidoglycan lipid II flippase
MDIKALFRNAGIVTLGVMMSRFLGFGREMVMASRFGTSAGKDAFDIGSYLPITFSNLLVAGVFSAVFIPLFTRYICNRERDQLQEIISVLINQFTIMMARILLFFYIFAPFLIRIQAPFFDQYRFDTAVMIFRASLPSIFFLGIAAIATGILNSMKMFGVPTLGGILFNALTMGFIIMFAPSMGIKSAAWALVLGSIGQLMIQYIWIVRHRLSYRWTPRIFHPAISEVYVLILPVVLGSGINYLAPFIERFFGSSLPEGMISALGYSFKVSQFPIGIFALAVSSVVFPCLSENVICNDRAALSKNLKWALQFVLFIIMPATFGLLACSLPITRLLFERGEFTAISTMMTSRALSIYALALVPWSITAVLVKIFYSNRDTKTPVYVALITIAVLFTVDIFLVKAFQYQGLAMGSTIAAYVNVILLWMIMRKKFQCIRFMALFRTLGSTLTASALMFAVLFISCAYLEKTLNLTLRRNQILEVGILMVLGVVIYALMIWLLDRKELKEVMGR